MPRLDRFRPEPPDEQIALGHFDVDTNLDVAVSGVNQGGRWKVFRGNGDGTFNSLEIYQAGSGAGNLIRVSIIRRHVPAANRQYVGDFLHPPAARVEPRT